MSAPSRILAAIGATAVVGAVAMLFTGGSESRLPPPARPPESRISDDASSIVPPAPGTAPAPEPTDAAAITAPPATEVQDAVRRPLDDDSYEKRAFPEVAILEACLVRDDGALIRGARVVVRDTETGIERICESDEAGRIVARPLHVGRGYSMSVRHADWIVDGVPLEPFHVGVNERTIRIESRVFLRGRVIEVDTHRPVAGVTLTLDRYTRRIVSDADGSFRVHRARTGVAPDAEADASVVLETQSRDGFGTVTSIPSAVRTTDREWVVYVGRGGRISGTIRSSRGDLIAGIDTIDLRPTSTAETLPDLGDGARRSVRTPRSYSARVHATGDFAFVSVPPRLRGEFALRLPSGVDFVSPAPFVALDGTDVAVELVIPDHPGVLLVETRDRVGPIEATLTWSGADVTGWKSTDEQGRLRIDGLPPGTLRVRAVLQERGAARVTKPGNSGEKPEPLGPSVVREVEIRADGETRVVLEVRDGRSLAGRVVDLHGSPVVGVRVTVKRIDPSRGFAKTRGVASPIVSEPPFQAFAITGALGEFAFAELPPDPRWLVGLDDPRYRYYGEDVAAGSEGIELQAIGGVEFRKSPPRK